MINLFAASIFLVIVSYAYLMSLGKITKFSPQENWTKSLLAIFTVGLPVAFIEETIFRFGFFDKLLTSTIGLSFPYAMMFTSLFFASVHFDLWWLNSFINWILKPFKKEVNIYGMHKDKVHKPELFIGLFFFSMVTCVLYDFFATYLMAILNNVVFHAMAIYGVSITAALFTKENTDQWGWLWDEGHELLRSPVMWGVMLFYFFNLVGG